jgi:hypothetical protein
MIYSVKDELKDFLKIILLSLSISGIIVITIFSLDRKFNIIKKFNKITMIEQNIPILPHSKLYLPLKKNIFHNTHSRYIDRPQAIMHLEKLHTNYSNKVKNKILLFGASGSGKSALAEIYAEYYGNEFKNSRELTIVKIFYSEKQKDLNRQYRDFAAELEIYEPDYDDSGLFEEVAFKLNNIDNWLLVFDNVNTIEDFNYIESNLIKSINSLEGRILITSNNLEIAKKAKKMGYYLALTENRNFAFNKLEINLLMAYFLEKNIAAQSKNIAHINNLAKNLCYLPQAIKKAASFIKNFPSGLTIKDYNEMIYKEIKNKTGLFLNCNQEHSHINHIINKVSIIEITKNNKFVLELLTFISFLNPDVIQNDLIELWFKEKFSNSFDHEVLQNSLNTLLKFSLIEKNGIDDFKLHRTMIPAILEVASESDFTQNDKSSNNNFEDDYNIFVHKKLNETIQFFFNNFKRYNFTSAKTYINSLFIPHMAIIKSNKMISKNPEFFYLDAAAASYYLKKGHALRARDTLLDTKIVLEQILSPYIGNLEEIKKIISEQEFAFLPVYAAILYHLGRTTFYVGDFDNIEYKNYLEKAVKIRQIIDNMTKYNPHFKLIDEKYNEYNLDSIITVRSGTLLHIRISSNNINDLKYAINEYYKLLLLESNNKVHFLQCKREILELQKKIALLENNKSKKNYLCDEALKEIFDTILQEDINNFQIVYKKILKHLLELEIDLSRFGKHFNSVADLYYIKGDYINAINFYNETIKVEKSLGSKGLLLANSYLGLAKINAKLNLPIVSLQYIDKCRQTLILNNIPSKHPKVIELIKLENNLKNIS